MQSFSNLICFLLGFFLDCLIAFNHKHISGSALVDKMMIDKIKKTKLYRSQKT